MVLILKKNKNSNVYQFQCYCCTRLDIDIVSIKLEILSSILGWAIYECKECRQGCQFSDKTCTRTQMPKKIDFQTQLQRCHDKGKKI